MAIILVFETTWQIDPNTTKSFCYTIITHRMSSRASRAFLGCVGSMVCDLRVKWGGQSFDIYVT